MTLKFIVSSSDNVGRPALCEIEGTADSGSAKHTNSSAHQPTTTSLQVNWLRQHPSCSLYMTNDLARGADM